MLARLSRHGKTIALVAGFVFSAVGALWALLVTDRLGADIQALSDQRAVNAAQIEALNRIASEYFIANQQGDLIFITAHQNGSDKELASDIRQGNMLDRATPVRNMIGELAIEKQLDFNKVNDKYREINEKARQDFTWANFKDLKELEAAIITKGQDRVPVLVRESAELDQQLNARKAQQSRNHVLAVVTALIGSAALLAANLISEREIADEVAAGEVPAGERPAEGGEGRR